MKKGVSSVFLAVILLITLVPVFGTAAIATEVTNVAKVGNAEYATIDEAIANWTNGSTLTLLADVTLSDVITLKSTEHHVLNLGTYTMTAASGKHAIEITCNGRSSASYALTINADAENPGGITATGKSCIYYKKSGSTKDRPIILINNGVFNGSYSINSTSNGNTNCPQIWINGGTFNGNVNLVKNMLRISGGTFNGWINCTGDSSAYRQITGGSFKSWQFMTADAPNKFWIGSGNGSYNVGCYVDDNGYLVVGGSVITGSTNDGREESFEASSANYGGWSSYLKYSSAATNGLYYTSVEEALADNTKKTSEVTVYVEELDMTGSNYQGKILIPEGHSLKITYPESTTPAWTVDTKVAGMVAVYDEAEGKYVLADALTISYNTNGGTTVSQMTVAKGYKATAPANPTKEGYDFTGWFKDEACTQAWSFDTVVTETMTLYAKWTIKTYLVTFDYGTAKETDDTLTVEHGTVLDLHNPAFNGYVFMGWYADNTYATAFDFTTPITTNTTIYAKFANYTGDLNDIDDQIAALNQAIADLQDQIDANDADIAAIQGQITTINGLIDALEAADVTLDGKITAAIDKAERELAAAVADLETKLSDELAKLQDQIDANDADIATIQGQITTINGLIDALKLADETLDGKITSAIVKAENDLKAEKEKLEALIKALEQDMSKTAAELKQTIADLKAAMQRGDANLKGEIDALRIALKTAKAALAAADAANRAALEEEINAAVATLQAAIDALAKDLEDTTAALKEKIDTKADAGEVSNTVAKLKEALTVLQDVLTKADADNKATLEEKINAANEALSEAIRALEQNLNEAKAELQAAIDNKADEATVNAAIAKLQNAITALENAKDNYITADAALKAELEAAIAKAKQEAIDAAKGHIPYIGENGNWWIGDTDTGVDANGIKGDKGDKGEDGITPKLRINSDNIWEVSYDDGKTWESLGISAVGQNGSNGTNGVTPKLRVNDKNIWEVSYDNGKTWESLGISAVGQNGTNGVNGTNGKDGADGKDGKDGADGNDGITPMLRINKDTNMWEVSYDSGKNWESLGVNATGADGITPQLRINSDTNMWEVSYDNGSTWTSMGVVATGADGKDGTSALPIVISSVSLAGMATMFVMMSDRKRRAYAGKH